MNFSFRTSTSAASAGGSDAKWWPRGWLGAHMRSLGLAFILAVIWLAFQFLTHGLFLTPRNLTNLSGQVATTAVLVGGIVLVMVPGYIDLSVGSVVAFCSVVTAIASSQLGLPVGWAAVVGCGAGVLIGIWHGVWVAYLQVPAFIVTLGSLMTVRGLALVITSGDTFAPAPDLLFISDYSFAPPFTIAFGVLVWCVISALQIREYRAQKIAELSPRFWSIVGFPVIGAAVMIVAGAAIALAYRGLPFPVFILICLLLSVSVVLRATTFGRRLYAIGSNRNAAGLAGVNIRIQSLVVFIVMGFLYGVAGLISLARLASAPPGGQVGLELNVIAAAVIGGTSLFGGRGTVGGAVLGAMLMESLNNGMSLMNLPSSYQSVVGGLVLMFAVFLDMRSSGRSLAVGES